MMYKLMIVDDEPLFTDGLAECLRDMRDPEWEIIKAYHAQEALQYMERTPADIMLLDIRMPGMTGLELHRQIQVRWPRCKVIYLTGNDEFSYVQEALRQGGVEYILKTEGDEVIMEALQKAAYELQAELQKEQWVEEARERWFQAKASLRKSLLMDAVNGYSEEEGQLAISFEELDIPLRADLPVLIVLGKVDHWPSKIKTTDCNLFLFAIQNIAQDLLCQSTNVFSVDSDRSHILWFLQPKDLNISHERLIYYTEGIMGQVQEKCKTLLQLDISLVMSDSIVPFGEIDMQYHRLKNVMFRHFGLQRQIFVTDRKHPQEEECSEKTLPGKRITGLKYALEHNQKHEFLQQVMQLADLSTPLQTDTEWQQAEVYFELVSLALATIQKLDMKYEVESRFDLSSILKGVYSLKWDVFLHEYRDIMAYIFDSRTQEWELQNTDLVLQIKKFIDENLHLDLSLTKIAEHVAYHPAYLSRLYKQLAGKNLSDAITEMRIKRAEQLLLDTSLKVHEIGKAIGFESPRYFTKFFKMNNGFTPQEFRERYIK
ncbi:hypothetical protein BK133_03790 [Paenibacillus sp. FSL H8-0548]|uniref:response regulator transcription factor n=1 Tax=Paenibacillus sp. FSL H8-0548 TaxID=1920422 RepID=UPI00096CA0E9|nr:response regulator [Paenibacillus sp. FSL H8-0548]OMF37674.1 hypothetical protein BK133_03790 [Paenibacillus sp. FSL H8-0548]